MSEISQGHERLLMLIAGIINLRPKMNPIIEFQNSWQARRDECRKNPSIDTVFCQHLKQGTIGHQGAPGI
jgi:hypothetical protein